MLHPKRGEVPPVVSLANFGCISSRRVLASEDVRKFILKETSNGKVPNL